MIRALVSFLAMASITCALESGVYVGVSGGVNRVSSLQSIDFKGTNLWNTLPGPSGPNGTSAGQYDRNGNITNKKTTLGFMWGLRAGYQYAFNRFNGIRVYGTFSQIGISIGVDEKLNADNFQATKYTFSQAGIATDYLLEFLRLETIKFGILGGVGYEHTFGTNKINIQKNQPYANLGLFTSLGREGKLFFEVGAKLPFSTIYESFSDARKGPYIYLSQSTGVEYSERKESLNAKLQVYYIALSYVF
ncbi:hypothetical protein [Helicobacter sp. 10-6591]|uniref:hypothetical protein n=1 Tax=Helicobacter sp. 10-6591 TaxID=2004998 RepID=UPI000DCD8905|nr:hypothetical protein [Helicobacter sp. 10-6591]RAX56249.1 hypothetical protein CCY97_00115 [Helicobacter sp. 10-6591]